MIHNLLVMMDGLAGVSIYKMDGGLDLIYRNYGEPKLRIFYVL